MNSLRASNWSEEAIKFYSQGNIVVRTVRLYDDGRIERIEH